MAAAEVETESRQRISDEDVEQHVDDDNDGRNESKKLFAGRNFMPPVAWS